MLEKLKREALSELQERLQIKRRKYKEEEIDEALELILIDECMNEALMSKGLKGGFVNVV